LAIALTAFITILDEIAKIDYIFKRNKDFTLIIEALPTNTDNLLGFRCESISKYLKKYLTSLLVYWTKSSISL